VIVPPRIKERINLCCVLLVQAGMIVFAPGLSASESATRGAVVENFEQYGAQNFPERWRGGSQEARKVYRIEAESENRFLQAHADKQAVHLGLQQFFDPSKRKRLRWRWRVHALPLGADERKADKHDAAAQVYVIFDSQYVPRVIKYIWSSSLPVGTRFQNPLYGRGRVVVLRSGMPVKGNWYAESVNFYDDYKQLFGEEPGQVQGIGILTSSDSTNSLAIADYDDFALLP
jgi:hypothetical protein